VNFQRHLEEVKLDLQIAPLIDVVFLLLIYFMVTAALIKKEGDIGFMLPANLSQKKPITLPLEALIMVGADGSVELDGIRFSPNDKALEGLSTQLLGLQAIAKSQQAPFYVNILPNKETFHRRVIDVMDACAAAKVKNLGFSEAN
jgi:biopolymer transport protein ExbD